MMLPTVIPPVNKGNCVHSEIVSISANKTCLNLSVEKDHTGKTLH